ncbi:DUF4318 domain-containing protein [Agathobaculum sp.]|uniref:DUF4318 domain-containing protein n=1 Tax=Agathobaculum sp. TaxID=2048138 RepID=UPI002A83CF21|nr:DUF4318 domain-containing protein [Agathobaculum sp.]MDY3617681.1 DUF4318 domain-containing protein [Agathobaculum sp.]
MRKTIVVPYEENRTYPSLNTAKQAIAAYCAEHGYPYEFQGENEDGEQLVRIAGLDYKIRRGVHIGQSGPGGYGISCIELPKKDK